MLDPFPDPVGHFVAPWRPFWILQVSYVSDRRSARIKNLFSESCLGAELEIVAAPGHEVPSRIWDQQ